MVRYEHYDVNDKYIASQNTSSESNSGASESPIDTDGMLPSIKRLEVFVNDSAKHLDPEQHAVFRIIMKLLDWDSQRVGIKIK